MSVLAGLEAHVRVPTAADKVHKDECLFCFNTAVRAMVLLPVAYVDAGE